MVYSFPTTQFSFFFFHVDFSRNAYDQAEELHWLALSNPFRP